MNTYSGEVVINQSVQSNKVYISIKPLLGNFYLSTPDKVCRESLEINIFPSSIFTSYSHDLLVEGVTLGLVAKGLGFWRSGPTGFIGDNEFNVWPISRIDIKLQLIAESFELFLSGMTEDGYCTYIGKLDPSRTEPLEPLVFHVNVKVPKGRLTEVLNINQLYEDSFNLD